MWIPVTAFDCLCQGGHDVWTESSNSALPSPRDISEHTTQPSPGGGGGRCTSSNTHIPALPPPHH